MDAFKTAFEKLKALKGSMDASADEAQQGLVKANIAVGVPEEDAEYITQLAESGGNMAGSIGDVAGKAGKIFREAGAAKPVANRAASLENTLNAFNLGKTVRDKTLGVVAGNSQKARLDNLPDYAKKQVLMRMRELGIDPSKLKE